MEKYTLLDFWAPWCNPCKLMNPIIDEIEREYENVKVVRINVDEDSSMSDKYDIQSIPTYILQKDNEIVSKVVGAMPKYKFIKTLGLDSL